MTTVRYVTLLIYTLDDQWHHHLQLVITHHGGQTEHLA